MFSLLCLSELCHEFNTYIQCRCDEREAAEPRLLVSSARRRRVVRGHRRLRAGGARQVQAALGANGSGACVAFTAFTALAASSGCAAASNGKFRSKFLRGCFLIFLILFCFHWWPLARCSPRCQVWLSFVLTSSWMVQPQPCRSSTCRHFILCLASTESLSLLSHCILIHPTCAGTVASVGKQARA